MMVLWCIRCCVANDSELKSLSFELKKPLEAQNGSKLWSTDNFV